jgi:hypothetical protein
MDNFLILLTQVGGRLQHNFSNCAALSLFRTI